ncbi:hypothetical protein ACFVUS_12580 [Nocardia sp. NPDC058058]|uniref:hypothetical protein n=1 Tax=Nocardia sp. NPDC058058 TaxID=3346317 RepID=UPI0036DD3921
MRKATALSAALLFAAFLPFAGGTATPANADQCNGDWSIVMGGFTLSGPGLTGEDSSYLAGDQRIGYNSADPYSGLNELDRLFWSHRGECPGDHIRIVAHSEGAGIAHAWVTAHQDVDNANAVLIADPKRAGDGSGWDGLSVAGGFLGYPLAGVDDWFGGFPVLEICNRDDQICDTSAGWWGYLFGGAHGRYDFNAYDYGDGDSGTWYQ